MADNRLFKGNCTKGRTFFIYDHTVLQKEEDDLQDAIIYFYPQSVDSNSQCALCGQLMGMVTFFSNILGSKPSLYRLEKEKYAVKHVGKYTLALAGDLSEPDPFLAKKLETLYSTFAFYQGSISLLEKHAEEKELGSFNKAMAMVWNSYLPFIRCYDDDLSAAFKIIPGLMLPKNGASLFLRASHLLQTFKRKAGVLGGCLFFKNKVLCSQLSPELTAKLCLIKPIQAHFPCQAVKTDYDLPNRVRLIEVYLTKEEYEQLHGACIQTYTNDAASEQEVQEDETANNICFSLNADEELPQLRPRLSKRKLSPKSSNGTGSLSTSSDAGDSNVVVSQLAVIRETDKSEEKLPCWNLTGGMSHSDSGVASQAESSPEFMKKRENFSSVSDDLQTGCADLVTVDISERSQPKWDLQDSPKAVEPDDLTDLGQVISGDYSNENANKITDNQERCIQSQDSKICDNNREYTPCDTNDTIDAKCRCQTGSDERQSGEELEVEAEQQKDSGSKNFDSATGHSGGHDSERSNYESNNETPVTLSDNVKDAPPDFSPVRARSETEELVHVEDRLSDILPVRPRSETADLVQLHSKSEFLCSKLQSGMKTKSFPEMIADQLFTGKRLRHSAPNLVINEPDDSIRRRGSTFYYDALQFDTGHGVMKSPQTGEHLESSPAVPESSLVITKDVSLDEELVSKRDAATSEKGQESDITPCDRGKQDLSCRFDSIHSSDSAEKTPVISSGNSTPTATIVGGTPLSISGRCESFNGHRVPNDSYENSPQTLGNASNSLDNLSDGNDVSKEVDEGQLEKDKSVNDFDFCQRTSTPRNRRPDNLPSVLDVSTDSYSTQISSPLSADYHDCQSDNAELSQQVPQNRKSDSLVEVSIKSIMELSATGLDSCGPDQERRDRREKQRQKVKLRSNRDRKPAPRDDDSLNTIQIKLYVQGHSDIVLLLLIEKYHLDDEALVHSLYKPSLIELADMEAEIKACHDCHEGKILEVSGSPYNYLHYDIFERDLKGNMMIPVAALETEFIQTSIFMHEDFSKSPRLTDVTLRSHMSTVYGHHSETHETYYQPPQLPSKLISSDIPLPNDANYCLENRCKNSLLKDHNIVVLR
ncbi:uncharacterized protein LOC135502574 [Lineus longissimus]|uniref:uncharacterized protein LOC135502574 n=1 Tax=Lineus longissimus TaxID=88925 RepID=UPI00315DDE96